MLDQVNPCPRFLAVDKDNGQGRESLSWLGAGEEGCLVLASSDMVTTDQKKQNKSDTCVMHDQSISLFNRKPGESKPSPLEVIIPAAVREPVIHRGKRAGR
jgi:hypothetical protein